MRINQAGFVATYVSVTIAGITFIVGRGNQTGPIKVKNGFSFGLGQFFVIAAKGE